jgi:HSP20 family protein
VVIVYFDVWDELTGLERRLDDVFRTFVAPLSRLTFVPVPMRMRKPFVPAVDVLARDGGLVIRAELPGIDPAKDIQITFEPGELVIRGERKHEEEVKEDTYYRMESSYGSFERHIPLPEGVDEKKVTAEYADGVLRITVPIPKALEAGKAKTITIKTVKVPKAA